MSKEAFKNTELIQASLKKRYARERRFQWYGRLAVLTGFVFLFILLFDIVSKGTPAFTQQYLNIPVHFDADRLGLPENPDEKQIAGADYAGLVKSSLRDKFPDVKGRGDKRALYRLVSIGAEYDLRDMLAEQPSLLGQRVDVWLLAHSEAASYLKGQVTRDVPEVERRVKDQQMDWLDGLRDEGRTESRFNVLFFTEGDSREPELASDMCAGVAPPEGSSEAELAAWTALVSTLYNLDQVRHRD